MTTSELLIPGPSFPFSGSLARRIGVNEALVLQWLHDRGGLVSHTGPELELEFGFWSQVTILRTLRRLRNLGLVQIHQVHGVDRRNTYTLVRSAVAALVESVEVAA